MIPTDNQKIVPIILPQAAKDNALWVGAHGSTPVNVDCAGWDHCDIYVMFGEIDDAAIAAFNVQQSDDTTAGNFAEIPDCDFTTDATAPTTTDDGTVWRAAIDLRDKKRYLNLELTAGNVSTGSYAVAWAVLTRGNNSPVTAAERGLDTELRV